MSIKPKVVHFTTVHKDNDPRIFHRLCKTLAQVGYKVVLLAPGEKAFSHASVEVKPLGNSKGRFHRMTIFQGRALIVLLKERAKIYHFHDPELMLLACILKFLGKKVIYDVHEDLPADIRLKNYIPYPVKVVLSFLASLAHRISTRVFNSIIVATPVICDSFKSNKAQIVGNFPDLELYENCSLEHYQNRENRCIYIGSIARNRGSNEMLEIPKLLNSELNIRLSLAGPISDAALYEQLQGSSVYKGYVDYSQTPALLQGAKIGLLLLHPVKTYQESLPLKLFEYMAAGLPVIASDFELWKQIIEGHHCGLLVDPLNKKAIIEAIEYLILNPQTAYEMGQKGRTAVEKKYNWKNESKSLLKIYNAL